MFSQKKFIFQKIFFFFEKKLEIIIPNFGYNFRGKKDFNFFMILLPFKCELVVWMNLIKLLQLKDIVQIPLFYLKRILLFIKKDYVQKKTLPTIIR